MKFRKIDEMEKANVEVKEAIALDFVKLNLTGSYI